ncbi:MAG: RNA-binding S4 domain-containing protein [Pseudomonadota bacterium]
MWGLEVTSLGADATPKAEVRLDRWLWAARLFKTRGLAQAAVRGGHVHVDGERAKPARAVRVGQRISVQKGEEHIELDVRDLADRRGSATAAATLYLETEASLAAREAAREARRLRRLRGLEPAEGGRPDRRERRARQQLRDRGTDG